MTLASKSYNNTLWLFLSRSKNLARYLKFNKIQTKK